MPVISAEASLDESARLWKMRNHPLALLQRRYRTFSGAAKKCPGGCKTLSLGLRIHGNTLLQQFEAYQT